MDSAARSEITWVEAQLANIKIELDATVTILENYYKNIACEKYVLDIKNTIYSIKNTLHV